MKHLKTYENVRLKLKEGEFAIFHYLETDGFTHNARLTPELRDFINNNVGRVTIASHSATGWVSVEYFDIPLSIQNKFHTDNTILLDKDKLVDIAIDKDEVEAKIASKKYNI